MVDPIMSDHLAALMLRLKTQLKLNLGRRTPRSRADGRVPEKVAILHEGHAIYFGSVGGLNSSEHEHIKEEFLAWIMRGLSPSRKHVGIFVYSMV